MNIRQAERSDLKSVLELQILAYQSEAELLNNYKIPPLLETLADLELEFDSGIVLKMEEENGKIIGSVRGYEERGTFFIGKLMVHPDYRGRGLGTELLRRVEELIPAKRLELFTSDKSVKNIQLYERVGYQKFKEKQVSLDLRFVYMEKLK